MDSCHNLIFQFPPLLLKTCSLVSNQHIISNSKSDGVTLLLLCMSMPLPMICSPPSSLASSQTLQLWLFVLQPLWPKLYLPPVFQAPSQGLCSTPAVTSTLSPFIPLLHPHVSAQTFKEVFPKVMHLLVPAILPLHSTYKLAPIMHTWVYLISIL